MKRRDFLKGLSAIVPASLLAKLAMPTSEIEQEPITVDLSDGTWHQNGGVVKPYNEADWMENCGYFVNSGRNRNKGDNT